MKTLQFIPAHWLELAWWNRPMIVFSRPMPDPKGPLSQQNCKQPISSEKRTAA